jgi:hypothetical protein
VPKSIFSPAKTCPRITATIQGAATAPITAPSLRRGEIANIPAMPPAMRKSASTPMTSSAFAQKWSSSMSGMEIQAGSTSMIA